MMEEETQQTGGTSEAPEAPAEQTAEDQPVVGEAEETQEATPQPVEGEEAVVEEQPEEEL